MNETANRQWYQVTFSLRDLFWLILVVAILLAFLRTADYLWVDHASSYNAIRHAEHRQDELLRAIQAEGYSANWNESKKVYELKKAP